MDKYNLLSSLKFNSNIIYKCRRFLLRIINDKRDLKREKIYSNMGEPKKVAWNTSEGLINEISNRRSYANTHFVNGDIKKAFNNLIAIKQSVIQSFTPEEREKLAEMEKKYLDVSLYLSRNNPTSFSEDVRKAFHMARQLAFKVYTKYNDYLMDLLEARGYLLGEATDASIMKF